jgi:UDPglucose 6-dehydrogenase
MKITIVGTGYVGLVSGAAFADLDNDVVCVDNNESIVDRLNAGEITIFEDGLGPLVERGVSKGKLKFAKDLASAAFADLLIIAVGTPADAETGVTDLQAYFAAGEEIGAHMGDDTVVVTKSTVPLGSNRELARRLSEQRGMPVRVASVPEFLREGTAIEDFFKQDRIVIGAEDEDTKALLRELHRPLLDGGAQLVETTLESSELIKCASNAFLGLKVAFGNEIANLCEASGADIDAVARGMALDKRIGSWGLKVGPGVGGSCLPKDMRGLVAQGESFGVELSVTKAAIAADIERKDGLAGRVAAACGGDLAGKTVSLLGVTYKPGTDDVRDSAALILVPALLTMGAKVRIYDPEGQPKGRLALPQSGIAWAENAAECLRDADVAVVLTEWDEFEALDLKAASLQLTSRTIVDFRNVFELDGAQRAGLNYISLGRPTVRGAV